MPNKIDSFHGNGNDFLSNFYPSRIVFVGLWRDPKTMEYLPMRKFTAETVEHAYQACKMEFFKDGMIVLSANTPGQAKRLGRKFPIKQDWDQIKYLIMMELCKLKFRGHPDLAKKLKDTGDAELIEGNTWGDVFWGQVNGKGHNHLGKILMEIRGSL